MLRSKNRVTSKGIMTIVLRKWEGVISVKNQTEDREIPAEDDTTW